MNKKKFIIILLVLMLLSLNFCVAQDIDNSIKESSAEQDLSIDDNQTDSKSPALIPTHIDIESNTSFDIIGDDFKVRLSDENGTAITNNKVIFNINGVNYNKSTDNNGIAFISLKLDEGSYKISSMFLGDSIYKASHKNTWVTINNTRVVDAGLSNTEIQNIIDNAKENNVILFNGYSYEDINLLITKSLTLISNSNTVLTSTSSNPVITIRGESASSTTITGFTLKGKGNGILISDADYVTIVNNNIGVDSDGIVATSTNYLNITKNNLTNNANSAIVVAQDNNTFIINNDISKNKDGITITKSNNTFIHSNQINDNKQYGISVTDNINGVDYGEGPQNLNIASNTINNNGDTGIQIYYAEDDVKILGNDINSNRYNGITMNKIGNYLIQSNNIVKNKYNGIEFTDEYIQKDNQNIVYNAIHGSRKSLEARDTYYQETGNQLKIGENWYSDWGFVCPKIDSKGIRLTVTQIGGDYFQATFTDSKGNVASLIPDRTLTYKTTDGNTISVTISGGTGVFKISDTNLDSLLAIVDRSERLADYDKDLSDVNIDEYSSGETPSYSYPSIPYAIKEGMGKGDGYGDGIGDGEGDGEGNGEGNGNSGGNSHNANGNTTKSNTNSPKEKSEFRGNSTVSQNNEPSSNANNPMEAVSQSSDATTTSSQASASTSTTGGGASADASQSVVKQITIDEEDIFKVTGISFIILLILLTIGYYYKDDIEEMKSKM